MRNEVKNYQQLEVGDYVVHVNHRVVGILGLKQSSFAGTHQDYLTIVFAGQAAIHVPIRPDRFGSKICVC